MGNRGSQNAYDNHGGFSEKEGREITEPERNADEIIEDLERRIEQAASQRKPIPCDELSAEASDHLESIRRRADGQ